MHALTRVECDIKCYFSVFTLIQCFAGVHVLAYVKYFLSYLIYSERQFQLDQISS